MLGEEVSYKILVYESKLLQIKTSTFPHFPWMTQVQFCKRIYFMLIKQH